ncbi:MAG: helix-turn-helix domain-containing protein [Deltaproteobacteria bacterium]|nr:helix-turn-helix domain-containing protein [Deltaproteobacteria bacterium]
MTPPSSTNPTPTWLSTRAMAAVLGVSPAALRALAHEGRVPFIRVSPRSTRFSPEAVIAALQAERGPQAALASSAPAAPPPPVEMTEPAGPTLPPSPWESPPSPWGPPGRRLRRTPPRS